jgi:molybdopterin converting factor subunit 1
LKISVLAFARFRELLGFHDIKLEIPDKSTVTDLINLLTEQYPQLNKCTSKMIAVNQEYCGSETVLKNGDIVALIPPVSGG